MKGRALSAEQVAEIEPDDYPPERYSPPSRQVGVSLALALAGFGTTQGIARLGVGKTAG